MCVGVVGVCGCEHSLSLVLYCFGLSRRGFSGHRRSKAISRTVAWSYGGMFAFMLSSPSRALPPFLSSFLPPSISLSLSPTPPPSPLLQHRVCVLLGCLYWSTHCVCTTRGNDDTAHSLATHGPQAER